MAWERNALRELHNVCTGTKSFGPVQLRMANYTPNGPRRLHHNCRGAQRRLEGQYQDRRYAMQVQAQRVRALQGQAMRITQAEAAGYRDRMARRGGFDDGLGYSDDLYSPHLTAFQDFQHMGPRDSFAGLSPRMATRRFGYDPQLQLINNDFSSPFYQTGFSHYGSGMSSGLMGGGMGMTPDIFSLGGGVPSYAMPPNVYGPQLIRGPGLPQRHPAGYRSYPIGI